MPLGCLPMFPSARQSTRSSWVRNSKKRFSIARTIPNTGARPAPHSHPEISGGATSGPGVAIAALGGHGDLVELLHRRLIQASHLQAVVQRAQSGRPKTLSPFEGCTTVCGLLGGLTWLLKTGA